MSHYAEVECQFLNVDLLVETLEELEPQWAGHIEVHDTPKHLYGFQNDVRPETANVIVRRRYVGSASNDIGFNCGARSGAIISEYDSSRYDTAWLGTVKVNYAEKVSIAQMARSGARLVRRETEADGSRRLVFEVA